MRHRGSRYAIRAGRNLPDKEFRYLRTVIVTAAVYWGFNSKLHYDFTEDNLTPLNLPAPGRRQAVYLLLIEFAQPCVFDKQSLPPFHCDPQKLNQQVMLTIKGVHLIPKLRCQVAEFLNQSLTQSPEDTHPTLPESVYGTGNQTNILAKLFLESEDYRSLLEKVNPRIHASGVK